MSSIPHNARFRYLFNRRSLRAFVVPMDHGISMGPIPGLYACGDSAGGLGQHGICRAATFGRIAGYHVAQLT